MKERIPWSGALRLCRACQNLKEVPGLNTTCMYSPALATHLCRISERSPSVTPVAASPLQEVERAGAAALKKAAAANATVDKAEAATAETEDALVRLALGTVGSVGGVEVQLQRLCTLMQWRGCMDSWCQRVSLARCD